GELTEPRNFNLMFQTYIGPVQDESGLAYLRPETAQGIFVNFVNVQQTMRRKLPFGIAQIGKSFRNEITPGNFTFRTREFEQMEIEYFVRPGEDQAAHRMWIEARQAWYHGLGMRGEALRVREHEPRDPAKLRELVDSFERSVAKRDSLAADVRTRLVAEAEAVAAALPASLPRLLGLMEDPEANKIEVMKKLRGVGEKIGEEHTRTVLH